ncbi:winged helix-turn-helix transcriptional regulator [Leyella stercorea]
MEDISLVLLRDYLVKVGSKLADEVITTPLATILDQMELYTGPKENRLLRNVAAMMFCENQNKFFPYTQIDVVTFPNGKMKDPNNFTEVTFKGSVPQMIKQTMDYIKSNVLKEHVRKVSGRQEAERFWNYPYDAIEEAVVNSVYHRDFLQHEPIEITIEPSGISILNCPGPDRSISKEDIAKGDMLKSRRYRNRRLGDFLKELDLTEGRSTGVPTIQAKLAENGSPRAIFETTDDRLTFLVTIPIHEGCSDSSETKSESSGTSLSSSEESIETVGFSSEKSTGSSEKTSNSSEKILELIKQNPKISAAGIAMEIGISSRGVEKQIKKLREAGIIKRNGADKGGYWEIVILDND